MVFLLLCGLILGPVQSWGLWRSWRRRPSCASATYGTVAWAVFFSSTGLFVLLSLVAVANYYWNILAYGLLLPLAADGVLPPPAPQRQAPKLAVGAAQGIGLVVATALVVHYTVVPITALLGIYDPDTAALYGWDTLATEVTQQRQLLTNPLLLTTDYRSASAPGLPAQRWRCGGHLGPYRPV